MNFDGKWDLKKSDFCENCDYFERSEFNFFFVKERSKLVNFSTGACN